jgi:hypothetical protein
MDKKYFIAVNICSFYLLRGTNWPTYELFPGRILAALISDCFDFNVLLYYSEMCREPSIQNFIQFSVSLYQECMLEIGSSSFYAPILSPLMVLLEVDIRKARNGDFNEFEIRRFIPPPDCKKNGTVFSMLPHVNAFANLYARVNYAIDKNLRVEVIHDENASICEILTDWEHTFKENKFSDLLMNHMSRNPCSDHVFTERFSLRFEKSNVCAGIQIADVIAGFCTRHFNQTQKNQGNIEPVYREIVNMLRRLSSRDDGKGLNMVTSVDSIRKFNLMSPKQSATPNIPVPKDDDTLPPMPF